MINIQVSFPTGNAEAKVQNSANNKKPTRRKPKQKKKSVNSNTQDVVEGENANSNESKRTKEKASLKPEKNKPPLALGPLAQGGATLTGAIPKTKLNKKAKKRAEAAAAALQSSSTFRPMSSPSVKNHQTQNGAISKESPNNTKKSPKKSYAFYSSNYRGLAAFHHLPRTGRNIWSPTEKPKKTMEDGIKPNSSNCSIVENVFIFDIKRICKPSTGYFRHKRSPHKYVNLQTFGPKFPVIFNSYSKDQTLNTTLERVCEGMNEIDLNGSSMSDNLNDNSYKLDTTVNTSVDLDVSNSNSIVQKKSRRTRKHRGRIKTEKKEKLCYTEYMNLEQVEEGLKNGSLIKGYIRINPRNCKEAYVSNATKGESDYIIKSILDQNRALEGDEIVLKIKPEAEWDSGRKTAVVVHISKMVHTRTTVGKLSPKQHNGQFAEFIPRDKRFPHLQIPKISWPEGYETNPGIFHTKLYLAKLTEWSDLDYAKGLIVDYIGVSGDLKIENLAILKSSGLDYEPFDNEVLKYIPKTPDLQPEWLEGREDLRKDCIFTIDPLTARDLDDAMSCKSLPDGNLEVGVHIADVGFFLKEGTELDKRVSWKATTIYMVNNVYHMLPVELCMNCSLLPGKDKLAFSVFWIMTPEGEILNTRFAKTVINSCCQMAYEHAQAIIDDPDNFDRSFLPQIENGYTVDDAKEVVLKLYHISKNLRQKRFDNGALRIQQVKLSYELDPISGHPVKYFIQEMKEANKLIEEFMLLANMSVAKKTLEHFPDVAFLRLHEPPKANMLVELKRALESVGIHVDITSAKSIQTSLSRYDSDDQAGKIRSVVLNHLFAKAMTRARYFCPEVELAAETYDHYALNVPLYTHFTSPIRRYADVMVHRLLAASLGLAEKPGLDSMEVGEIAARCNLNKYCAKKAQEESSHLYLRQYVLKNAPFIRDAAVVDVRERNFDVIVLECGEVVRIQLNEIAGASWEVEDITNIDLDADEREQEIQRKYWRVTLAYPQTKQYPATMTVIEMFTLVRIELKSCPKTRKLVARLIRPNS